MRCAVIPLLALWLWPRVSDASVDPVRVLLLSVKESRSQDLVLQRQLVQGLRSRGAQVIDPQFLTEEELRCGERACLLRIARAHNVQHILQATLRDQRSRVDVTLFDVRTQETRKRGSEGPGSVRAESLIELCANLLSVGQLAAASPPTTTAESGDALRVRPWAKSGLPAWRLGVGIGLASLGIGFLATAAVTSRLDRSPGDCLSARLGPSCYYDLRPVYIPSYVVAGGALVGSLLTFVLPSPESSNERKGK